MPKKILSVDRATTRSNGNPGAIPELDDKGRVVDASDKDLSKRTTHKEAKIKTYQRQRERRETGEWDVDEDNVQDRTDLALSRYRKKEFGLAQAELAFLSGIVALRKLASIGQVTEEEIKTMLPEWKKSRMNMLKQLPSSPISLALAKDNIEKHDRDTSFLRKQLDTLQKEIEGLEDVKRITKGLLEIAQASEDLSEVDIKSLVGLVRSYADTAKQRADLMTKYTTLQTKWADHVGYNAHKGAAEAGLRAQAIDAAKGGGQNPKQENDGEEEDSGFFDT